MAQFTKTSNVVLKYPDVQDVYIIRIKTNPFVIKTRAQAAGY